MSDFAELFGAAIIFIGSLFLLLAAIGLIKMPDIYMRMSSTTKGMTFGVGLILIGVSIYFGRLEVMSRAFVIILFLFLTAPVAAHLIGRAAYMNDNPLWSKTKIDELKDKYDYESQNLDS